MVSLNKPLAGDTNWATPVNNNWTTIEGVVDQSICQGRLSLSSGNASYNPQPNTPASTDTVNMTVTFPSAHGWTTGTMVSVPSTAGGLTAWTVYYLNAISSTVVSFHTTLAAAEAGTSKVTLSASITALVSPVGVSRSTVYFTPFRGNRTAIFDGSTWKFYAFSEISVSISTLVANVTYDVFIYDNAGTLTIETLAWKKVTASSSPVAGTNVLVNLSDTTGLTIGGLVTIKDGSHNEIARVNAVVVGTSFTVDTLNNTYTTPDVYFNVRATDLALQDGLYVKSGALTRRYLGSIRITSAGGQSEDSTMKRFVWNYSNRLRRKLLVWDPTSSWGWTGGWHPANSNLNNRTEIVVGVAEDPVVGSLHTFCITPNGATPWYCGAGLGYDSITTDFCDIGGGGTEAQSGGHWGEDGFSSFFNLSPSAGYHFLQWLESGGGGMSFYGNSPPIKSGLVGEILA